MYPQNLPSGQVYNGSGTPYTASQLIESKRYNFITALDKNGKSLGE
jgi:hypothetical protein